LVILSGPSGVGKDTVIDAWRARNPRVQRVVAFTTRPPRDGEAEGVDYHFTTMPEFERMVGRGEFLEHKLVHGNYYATPIAGMEKLLDEGKVAVLKIDVQGALAAMSLRPDAMTVMLVPPSWEELERRIRRRGTEDEEDIQRRLQNAREEVARSDRYQHHIVNDGGERTGDILESFVADKEHNESWLT
jgi:guanylate kinase